MILTRGDVPHYWILPITHVFGVRSKLTQWRVTFIMVSSIVCSEMARMPRLSGTVQKLKGRGQANKAIRSLKWRLFQKLSGWVIPYLSLQDNSGLARTNLLNDFQTITVVNGRPPVDGNRRMKVEFPRVTVPSSSGHFSTSNNFWDASSKARFFQTTCPNLL